MRNIARKTRTLRVATASARLCTDGATIARLRAGDLPKGDPLPVARVAGIQAAKNTSQLLPYCHPLPIEYVGIEFAIEDTSILITTKVDAIHRTGVEMEALTAASVAALTLYDMLKAIDPEVMSIEAITLTSKTGGKGQFKAPERQIRAGVLIISDRVAAGHATDRSGSLICSRLEELGVSLAATETVPDETTDIERAVREWSDGDSLDLIITTGGTGLGPRDITPETILSLIERRLPGVEEAMRGHGQERTPYAMLSRGVAGQRRKTVIVCLPGSPRGVAESLDALLPGLLHAIPIVSGANHE